MKSNNIKRVEKKLFNFFSEMISFKLTNANINNVEITRVGLSNDKSICTVFINEESTNKQTMDALESSVPFIRRELAQQWESRRLPSIKFEYDKTNDSVDNVLHILDQIKKENEQ